MSESSMREHRPSEMEVHSSSYRGIASDEGVKVYNGAGSLCIEKPMCFDIMDPAFSSVDLLAAALLSEVMLCVRKEFSRRREDVMDLEGRARIDLANPLACVGVVGIEGVPTIERVAIDVYLFTFLDEQEAHLLVEAGLSHAVLYHSLQQAFPVQVRFSFAA